MAARSAELEAFVAAMDYDDYAERYRRNRFAVPWILGPLQQAIGELRDERCASAPRLIDDAAHRRGMERAFEASQRGERWLSRYTVLRFVRRLA